MLKLIYWETIYMIKVGNDVSKEIHTNKIFLLITGILSLLIYIVKDLLNSLGTNYISLKFVSSA